MMLRWISLVPAEMVYCRAASTRLNHRGASGTTSEGWFTSTCMPSSSPATSAIRTPSSEPVSFRMEPGARRLTAELARQAPEPRVLARLAVDRELDEPLAGPRVLPRRPPVDGHSPRQRHEPGDLRRMAPAAGGVTLVHERGRRDPPALVHRAEQVRLRHDEVGEEDLVEVVVAGHEHERPHGNPRRRHGNE